MIESYDRGAVGCISGAATADLFVEFDRLYQRDRDAAERRYRELLPLVQFQCQSAELFVATEKQILARRFPIDTRRPDPGVPARPAAIGDTRRPLYRAGDQRSVRCTSPT